MKLKAKRECLVGLCRLIGTRIRPCILRRSFDTTIDHCAVSFRFFGFLCDTHNRFSTTPPRKTPALLGPLPAPRNQAPRTAVKTSAWSVSGPYTSGK